MEDTLTFRSDEGRGLPAKRFGEWVQTMIRRSPNKETLKTTH